MRLPRIVGGKEGGPGGRVSDSGRGGIVSGPEGRGGIGGGPDISLVALE